MRKSSLTTLVTYGIVSLSTLVSCNSDSTKPSNPIRVETQKHLEILPRANSYGYPSFIDRVGNISWGTPGVPYDKDLIQRLEEARQHYQRVTIAAYINPDTLITRISMSPQHQGGGDSFMDQWVKYIIEGGARP